MVPYCCSIQVTESISGSVVPLAMFLTSDQVKSFCINALSPKIYVETSFEIFKGKKTNLVCTDLHCGLKIVAQKFKSNQIDDKASKGEAL